MLGLVQAIGVDGVRQFIEILHEALRAGVDQRAAILLARLRFVPVMRAIHQTENVVQESGAAQAMEGLARMLVLSAGFHDAIEQLQQHEFFAGAGHIGVVGLPLMLEVEEVPRLVNRLGAAGNDQRPLVAEFVAVGDQFISASAVNLHRRNEQDLRRHTIKAHFAGAEGSGSIAAA